MASPAPPATGSGCGPALRVLGLSVLGGAVLLGLVPRPLTYVVLGFGLATGFAVLLLWHQWRRHRLVYRRTDGSLPPLGETLFLGAIAAGYLPSLSAMVLVNSFTHPPLAYACLCPRAGGLVVASFYSVSVVVESGLLAIALTVIVGAVARLLFAAVTYLDQQRRRGRPGTDSPAPLR